MSLLQDIRQVTTGLTAPDMLRHLLLERFPGKTAVTVSLKSPSVVVLKMVADIEPATPVIFCNPKPVYPESKAYREELIDLLGLSNVTVMTQSEPASGKRAFDYSEKLINKADSSGAGVRETMHLNQALSPYKCWIKAAYHERLDMPREQRIDIYGGKVIVDLLRRRTIAKIDRFMKDHGLPYHPKIRHRKKTGEMVSPPDQIELGYHF